MSDLIDNIKSLREITGAGFLDCKKALEENDNKINCIFCIWNKTYQQLQVF